MTIHILFAGALRMAILALLVPAAWAFAAPKSDTASVSQVLHEVKVHAAEANDDAEILDSFSRSSVAWDSYTDRINEIRVHVNDLLHDYSRLQKMAGSATPQQREAINRLEPLLRDMANSLIKATQSLNDNRKVVHLPEFTTQVRSHHQSIDRIYEELSKYTDKNAG